MNKLKLVPYLEKYHSGHSGEDFNEYLALQWNKLHKSEEIEIVCSFIGKTVAHVEAI